MEELFRKLGLNENERETYLAVLRSGKIAPNEVAKITGVNRTTVYSVAKKLGKMGLMTQDLGQKVTYLVATPPDKLVALFEREEKKIAEKKRVAKTLAKELSSLVSEKHYSVPRIRFVEEADLEAYLYEAYPRWAESVAALDNIWRGFQDDTFTSRYEKWIEWTWTHHVQGNMGVEFFLNQAKIEKDLQKKHPTRHMKSLPNNISFDSSFWVTGEYLVMVQTRVRPYYLVEIHDVVMARNQQALFQGLWMLAPEKKPINK
ncbi:MAG: helix-turn-helix domain-containing protein [Candidatus Moraniibacteriota bacterium]